MAPRNPFLRETLVLHDRQNSLMLNRVKSLLKVELKENDGPLRLFALVNLFKTPGQAVLNSSGFNEPMPILMNAPQNFLSKPVGSHFGQQFKSKAS